MLLHGETFHVKVNGVGQQKGSNERHFYLAVDGILEEIYVKGIGDNLEPNTAKSSAVNNSKRPPVTREGQVGTAIPCKIIEVLVKVNDSIEAGQSVLVTEAMKMETEVVATISGKVTGVYVQKGESVMPEETLIEIEPITSGPHHG